MTAAVDRSSASTYDDRRERTVRMTIAVADASSIKKDHMIEQRPVAVRRRAQFLQVISEKLDVIRLDSGALLHFLREILVMRQWMMGLRDADLRIRSPILFASIHERGYSGEVGLESQQLQIVEKLHVLFEPIRSACGPLDVRYIFRALFFGLLYSSFHVAKRREVVVDL